MKVRLSSPEIEPQAEEIRGIQIMPPHQLGVLVVFLLELVDGLGGYRREAGRSSASTSGLAARLGIVGIWYFATELRKIQLKLLRLSCW